MKKVLLLLLSIFSVSFGQLITVKFSDQKTLIEEDQLSIIKSTRIKKALEMLTLNGNEIDLSVIDFQTFKFIQKLESAAPTQTLTLLNNATPEAVKLLVFNSRRLQLNGKTALALMIQVLRNPQNYGQDGTKLLENLSRAVNFTIRPDGKVKTLSVHWPEKYLGSDYWTFYQDADLPKVYSIIFLINYYQNILQKAAPIDTDFLKECFYKLDISHQNKLINDNLVVLS